MKRHLEDRGKGAGTGRLGGGQGRGLEAGTGTGSGPLRDDWGWLEPPEVGSLSLKSAIEVRISRLDFLGV